MDVQQNQNNIDNKRGSRFTSIKSKLLSAFIFSTILFIALVFSFLWYSNEERSLNKINDYLVSSQEHFYKVKLNERDFFDFALIDDDFFKFQTHPSLENHGNNLRLLQKDLEALKKVNVLNIRQEIESLQNDFREFADSFAVLKKVIVERGFKDFGKEGEMRQYIHAIETLSQEYPIDLSKILMIRRHEKDFFLRKKDKYVYKLKEAVEVLQADLKLVIADESNRAKIFKALENYKNLFVNIVNLEKVIGYELKSGLRHDLKLKAQSIEKKMNKIEKDILEYTQNIRTWSLILMWGLFIGFLILNLVLGYFVVQKLGRPINDLSVSIHNVIKKNFEKESSIVKIKSKDEIGRLSQDMGLMLNRVQERTDEVLAQKQKLAESFDNLKVMSEIGRVITSHLELNSILDAVYENINSLIKVNILAIGLYNQIENTLLFTGKEGDLLREGKDDLSVDNALSVWCFNNQQSVLINDVNKDVKKYVSNVKLPVSNEPLESLIYVPLKIKNKKIGVFTFQTYLKNHYTEYHLSIAQNLAIYLSIALDNANVYKKIEQKNKTLQFQRDEIDSQRATIEKTLQVVQRQTDKIMSSIQYASVMQSTIFPTKKEMKKVVEDYFQIFRPKDVVSGDFCWLSSMKIEDRQYAFFALADCTGHGVPGAFMSMMSSSILNQIIGEDRISEPAKILEKLNKNVQKALRQSDSDNQDGLDISLIRFEQLDKKKIPIVYAGAKHSIYIVDKDNEVERIKGVRYSIGGYVPEIQKKKKYENQTFELKKGEMIYFSSDGLPDIANPRRKRYGIVRYMQFIQNNFDKTCEEQKSILEKEIDDFQQGTEQRDDILTIGLRI